MYDLQDLKSLTVFVIEDDEYALETIVEFITYYCDNVVAFDDPTQALEQILKKPPHIILTDIKMPRLNGIELAKRVRQESLKSKIIFMSAYYEPELFVEAIGVRAEHFLLKPFGKDELFGALESTVKDIMLEQNSSARPEGHFFIDSTTNLPNRNQLVQDIKGAINPTLIIFEVVDFEEVGNVYGENIADKLLKEIASLYSVQVPQNRALYKFEYNQFAMLLEDFDEAKVKNLISLFDTLSILSSFEAYSIEIYFKLQYGVAIEKEKIVEKAYRALQHAKNSPAEKYSIYHDESTFAQSQKRNIIFGIRLREAIDRQNLYAFYQPIMNMQNGTINKYEALARIKVNNEIIPPNDFIPVGKHMGLHTAITKNMVTTSFRKFKDNSHSLSLNLSLEDFIDNDVINFIKQRANDFLLQTDKIIIEVTEDISLDEHSHILYKLENLKKNGFKVSIDDFGTKMSNLSNICLIEPDFIKIDGKFIKDLDTNNKNRAIVKGIVSIAQNIGAKTVAEYVHNEEILQIVKSLGVNYAQGYHIGIPSEFIEGD